MKGVCNMEKKFDKLAVELAVQNLLVAMGQDITREGLKETPRRVAGYWEELLEGEEYTNAEIAEKFKKDFIVAHNSLVVKEVKNIYSHCEHHLALMFNGVAYVAYVPVNVGEGYKVLGLSKIDRIVDLCSKRLQLQEKLAADIAECISLATGSDKIYVQLVMNHGCVSARGPKSEGVTDVTYLSKALELDHQARQEIETKIANLRR